MNSTTTRTHRRRFLRSGRALWAVLMAFLAFIALILGASYWYLAPAIRAATDATPVQKRQLAAWSALVLALVLFTLVIGLILVFRPGRFFLPRRGGPPPKTKYVDAWAESAKRLKVEEESSDE